MAETRSDYNDLGLNQVGSNPPDEPHISGGVRGPSGAKLGDLGVGVRGVHVCFKFPADGPSEPGII